MDSDSEGPTVHFHPPCRILRVQLGGGCGPCRNARLVAQTWGSDASAFPLQLRGQATQQIPQPHLEGAAVLDQEDFLSPAAASPAGMALTLDYRALAQQRGPRSTLGA